MRQLVEHIRPLNQPITSSLQKLKIVGFAAWLFILFCANPYVPSTQAAGSLSYSLRPTSGSYQPNATVSVEVSIKATQAFAGASVDVKPTNMTFQSFNTANAPQFILVDYHQSARDVVVICQNNNCAPGTYKVGTLYFKAGSSGSMSLKLTPVETADPDLKPMQASGVSSSYSIKQSATPSPPAPSGGSTYTVPGTSEGPSIVPTQVTEEDRSRQENNILTNPNINSFEPSPASGVKSKSQMPAWLIVVPIAFVMAVIGFLLGRRSRNGVPMYEPGIVVQPPTNDDNLSPKQ